MPLKPPQPPSQWVSTSPSLKSSRSSWTWRSSSPRTRSSRWLPTTTELESTPGQSWRRPMKLASWTFTFPRFSIHDPTTFSSHPNTFPIHPTTLLWAYTCSSGVWWHGPWNTGELTFDLLCLLLNTIQGGHRGSEDYRLPVFSPYYRLIIDFSILYRLILSTSLSGYFALK